MLWGRLVPQWQKKKKVSFLQKASFNRLQRAKLKRRRSRQFCNSGRVKPPFSSLIVLHQQWGFYIARILLLQFSLVSEGWGRNRQERNIQILHPLFFFWKGKIRLFRFVFCFLKNKKTHRTSLNFWLQTSNSNYLLWTIPGFWYPGNTVLYKQMFNLYYIGQIGE